MCLLLSAISILTAEMKSSLLLLLLQASWASCGFLSQHKSHSFRPQRCSEKPVEKCSWVEVPHVQNVTENVCKKVSKETCVTKMIPEVKAEQTRVCVDVSVTSCQDVLARRCDTPERTENRTVTTTECQPAQQKVSSEQSSGYIP